MCNGEDFMYSLALDCFVASSTNIKLNQNLLMMMMKDVWIWKLFSLFSFPSSHAFLPSGSEDFPSKPSYGEKRKI